MTSPQTDSLRSYGGEAGDARVARRRAALIDAMLDELANGQGGSVTVRAICERAKLTPRYFYESFAGTDDLVGATYDEVIAEIAEQGLAAFATKTEPRDKVAATVSAVVDIIDTDPRKGQLMFSDTLRSPEVVRKRAAADELFVRLTSESAAAALGLQPGLELTAAAYFQVGGLAKLLASWSSGQLEMGRDELIAVCVRMLMQEVLP